jgi:hypothetical protein
VDFLRGSLDMHGSNPELAVFTTLFPFFEPHGTTTGINPTRRSEAFPLLDMLFSHQSLDEAYEVHRILVTVHPFQDQTNKAIIPTTLIPTFIPSDSRERFKRIQSLFSLSQFD